VGGRFRRHRPPRRRHRHRCHRGPAHPELAKTVADLTVYQRTPIWVVPKIDVRFGERAKRLFARIPLTQRVIRWLTDSIYEVMVSVAVRHYGTFRGRFNVSAADLSKTHRFLSIRDKELRRRLTPDYDFGCKRPTFSNGYYRAFTKPHVHLQDAGIERIEADGIVGKDGTKNVIDTLVLATGFDLWEANFPSIEVVGGMAAISESGGATRVSRPIRVSRCRTSRTI